MQSHPDQAEFESLYDSGSTQVVYRQIIADLDTPVSAYLKLAEGEKYCFLLESVEGGDVRGRYSIIGLKPDLVWRVLDGKAEICRSPCGEAGSKSSSVAEDRDQLYKPEDLPPLESLRALLAVSHIDLPDHLPPMAAGIVGYMGYDMVRQMEDLPLPKDDPVGVPTAIFIRPTVMAIFDSVTNLITVVTPVRPRQATSATDAYISCQQRLEAVIERLEGPLPLRTPAETTHKQLDEPVSNTSPADYETMVRRAQEYILAGDIFQVVLSQRFSVDFPLPPFALYRALRRTNPSPFMYHLNFPDFAIVGSSPEILVRLRGDEVTIRPIAGTRRRGESDTEDRALEQELLADPKELSEHLMLLDLGRNDVGRVAEKGSVRVTSQNTVERYSHVMHIVSNVTGTVARGLDAIDVLKAGFPAGTVSGAPKIRAMEIIDSLEQDARGPYAGSVGYFSAAGDMDTCIVLRTAIVRDGVMHVQAGAGIVADSDPLMEQQECENKARALIGAASEAMRLAGSNRA